MSRSFRTKVVGITFQNPDGTKRQEIISKCKVDEYVLLKRDYKNSHDQYAIAVLRETGEQIGFIARHVAFRHEGMNDLAPHIDQGGEVTAKIVKLIGEKHSGFWSKHYSYGKTNWECIIEIEVGNKPYQVKESEARELRDKAKTLEKTDPKEAIRLYKQSITKLLEVDTLIRETHFFKNQIAELGYDLGTWRRMSLPIERITALHEKDKNYSECLTEIENYENMDDKKGLSESDIKTISKRKDRISKKIFLSNNDGLVKSRNLVIPAKAGIQNPVNLLDSDFHRNDEKRHNWTFYETINNKSTEMSITKEIKLEFEDSTKTIGKYLIFDVETTGLPIDRYAPPDDFENWPYIVQIAWLLFDNENKLIEDSNFYLKQPVEIPTDATKIHRITTAMMLEKGVQPSNVYGNFKKAVDNTEYIICHNIDFEIPIISCDFLRNGMQWNFPNNKMLCTMKTGTKFCKIPPYKNGEYKWPTLTELYQSCFFPNVTVLGIRNIHSANIDAAMTAQCFFKLKELGLFSEKNSKILQNNLFNEQIEEDLHEIVKYIPSDKYTYVFEIKHLGLKTYRLLKYDNKRRLDDEIEAQFNKWDEQWAKICHKKKLQTDKEANLKIAEELTKDAQGKQKQIDDLLIYALNTDNTVNWDSLKDIKNFKVPSPKNNLKLELNKIIQPPQPTFSELPKEPNKVFYEPQFSLVDKIFKSLKEKKIKQTEALYQEAMGTWKKSVDEINSINSKLKEQYKQKLKDFEEQKQIVKNHFYTLEKKWEKEKEAFYNNQKAYNEKIEKLKGSYFQKDIKAVIQYCEIVLNNSQYPETFPRDFDLDYNPDSRLLIVEYILLTPEDLPTLAEVKYIASKNELKELFLSEAQLLKNYESVIYKITLRTLHELFEADKAEVLESIVFNGWVNTSDKATGKKINNCIVSIQAQKIEFKEIELSNVDPKVCFKHLKGIGSSKLSNIIAVQPIAQINKNKKNKHFTPPPSPLLNI